MSAFNDIWFSVSKEYKPQYVRAGNEEWVEKGSSSIPYWLSLPRGEKGASFINTQDDDRYRLILLGQLYEVVKMEELLNRCINHIESNKEFVDPAGHYIVFVIDKKEEQLHVFTNRFGTYHAYWLWDGENSAVATPYISIAKQSSSKKLDWEGITSFLGQGFFANDNTFLANIKILEPASHYKFDKKLSKTKHKRYWDWQHNTTGVSISEKIDQVHQSLLESVAVATTNRKVALPISGGLDSRTLLGVLTEGEVNYKSLWGYSYGYTKNSIETRISKKLAKVKGVSFDGYKLPNYLFDRIDQIAESVDLFQYIDGTRQASMVDILQEKSDVVIGGHWGDVWFDNMGIEREVDLEQYYQKKIVKRGSDWLLENICKEYVSAPHEVLNDNFNSFMFRYRHIKDVDFRMKVYKTDQWSFRWTLPSIRMYQAGVMPVLPFYDKNVATTLSSIPTKELVGRSFQIAYIKKVFPELAKVRWQEYGTNLYLYKKINNRNLIYRGVKKGQRLLSPQKHIVRNWELFYLNDTGKEKLTSILLDNTLENLLSQDKIKSMLEDFYANPTAANGYTISMLHTLVQFLKRIL